VKLPLHLAEKLDPDSRRALDRQACDRILTCEGDLHEEIRGILNRRGIIYFESRMDKRTTQRKGVPDFIFSVAVTSVDGKTEAVLSTAVPQAWECKFGYKKLTPEQAGTFAAMSRFPNCWRTVEIRSVSQALQELSSLGL